MSTPAANVVKIDWKQVCPWIALLQTFGLAFHVRQILVGSVAALAIAAAHWFVLGSSMPYVHLSPAIDNHLALYWPVAPVVDLVTPFFRTKQVSVTAWFEGGGTHLMTVTTSVTSWSEFGSSLVLLAWTLLVGGLAGGILARRAAFEFAREESLGLWKATRFVLKRTLDYLSAPLLPLCGVLVIGVLGVLAGWLARGIPYSTSGLVAIWIVPLAFGVLAACLLFAVFAGWAMMVAAVSVNGGDGFDGLSRAFGIVLDRWRYYAFCVLLLIAYGNVALFIVLTALHWGDFLANTSILLGLGAHPHGDWTLESTENPWHCFLSVLVTGFAYSFFWSGMTVTYLLLRKSLDNAELDSVYNEENPTEGDGLAALLKKNPVPRAPTLLPIIDLPNQPN